MLDTDTKRRIDTARDILVGKVPDPKSQVEQITIALIYKFMDDMDAESEEFGGKRKFFAGEFARYGWAKLMRSGLGGHETLNLYAEAIAKMPENPGIPLLFRDIFKNAYLPYRDPETLRAFLKIIDEFNYDHSERLGDAFEYLLSVLGSQGDAGQFRTPRHIIDFMIEVIDPKKNETVLDPACGTAGFLISSYKHILKSNTDTKGNSTLTPDEKGRLAQNFKGYDISPDMVRLSLVNMYLHGFADPHIAEYDTLTSQDRWNEYADVILANPPFMSPKGGIKPHNRFSVQSKRSEVLFVDYMAEHLTPSGRAGIIVPEGIIFQSQTAYKQLRKMLVEECLIATISLPAGVFNPYSGVKTSILILDKSLAKKTKTIAFFKVENDGFGLGAQRREIDKNDLPQVHAEIGEYLRRLRASESVADYQPVLGLIVEKKKVATNGDYNLSGERYRENGARVSRFPIVDLSELADFLGGYAFSSKDMTDAPLNATYRPVVKIGNIGKNGMLNIMDTQYHAFTKDLDRFLLYVGDIVIAMTGATVGKVAEVDRNNLLLNQRVGVVRAKPIALQKYLLILLQQPEFYEFCQTTAGGGAQGNIAPKDILKYQIPLPPMNVQKEIVTEIEGYQKVIDGARAVLDNYRPDITIHSDWPIKELGEICDISPDTVSPASDYPGQTVFYIDISAVENETGRFLGYTEILSSDAPSRARRGVQPNDVLLSTVRPNLKAFTILRQVHERTVVSTGFAVLRAKLDVIDPGFLFAAVRLDDAVSQMVGMSGRGAYPSINQSDVATIKISLPPLATQQAIVAEIEAEQTLVAANRELIERFEKKIQATLARVWGEDNTEE